MRFLDLRLMAYGPFTDHRLDLSGGSQGLHIVYGPNEAGKSASLRAISALLYGIPTRSQDNFIHSYNDLRVGGNLLHSTGEEQVFIRRKGRKNTLLDENENPLDDNALNRFLSVLDGNIFEHLYGINHQTLLDGGLEMKSLKGQIGETLFSAGLGSGVNDLLNKLAEEDKALAAPRSAQGIVRHLANYKEIKKEIGNLALGSRDWQETEKDCNRLQKEIDELTGEVLSQVQERSGLERRLRNLPRIAVLAQLKSELADQEPVVALPETYSSEKRHKAVSALEQALAEQKRQFEKLAVIDGQVKAITLPDSLLENGEQIRQLYRKLDTHQTAAVDREQLIAKRIQKENDAKQALLDLSPDLSFAEVEKLRLSKGELAKLRELCVEYGLMHERPQTLAREIEQLGRSVTTTELELKEIPAAADPLPLEKALKNASRQNSLEQNLADARKRQGKAGDEARQALAQLGFKDHTEQALAAFIEIIFPSPETVDLFDGRFRVLEQKEARLGERIAEMATETQRLETEIESFHKAGHDLTEAKLVSLREVRDGSWQQVKEIWLAGKQVDIDPQNLATSYESEVSASDEASDRLRREAAQVQQLARFEVERDTAVKRQRLLSEEKEELAEARRELGNEWREIWRNCLVTPGLPQEMRGWLSRYDRAVNSARTYFEESRLVTEISEAIAVARKQIAQLLASYDAPTEKDEPLADLVIRAEECFRRITKQESERERLTRTLAERKALFAEKNEQLREENARLIDWQIAWKQAIDKLPLDHAQATPGPVTTVIDGIDALFDNIAKINGFNERINAIDKNRHRFAQDVAAIVQLAAPDLAHKKDEEAITLLFQQLEKADKDLVKLTELNLRQQELAKEKEQTADTIDKARTYLASLCQEVGCEGYESLPEIEKKWAVCKQLQEEKLRCEKEIINDGGGLTLAEIASEIQGLDADHLAAQINAFASKLQELDRQKNEKARAHYALEEKKRTMDGNDRAADVAEQASLAGTQVGRAVHRYLRVKLAGALLRRRIEEHRRQSQSPVLARANEFFRQISLGGFSELTTDFVDDQQILIGIRDTG
ncbi:MAG: AAA family ATPase, partial [Desulfobulbaceae bacterium]|nr:AAA family ATPase [Desulfobulbaceae bacterium]